MPSQIEARYDVPLPIDLLWRELEERYGAEAVAELRAIHQRATQRYSRAGELNKMRRLLRYWEMRTPDHPKLAQWRATLADPQAYIDRE